MNRTIQTITSAQIQRMTSWNDVELQSNEQLNRQVRVITPIYEYSPYDDKDSLNSFNYIININLNKTVKQNVI